MLLLTSIQVCSVLDFSKQGAGLELQNDELAGALPRASEKLLAIPHKTTRVTLLSSFCCVR